MKKIKQKSFLAVLLFLLLIGDFIALLLALKTVEFFNSSVDSTSQLYWIITIILSISFFKKIYTSRYDFWGDLKAVLYAYALSILIVLSVFTLADISNKYELSTIFEFFAIAFLFTILLKRLLKRFLFSFDIFKIRVKLIAQQEHEEALKNEIKDNWYFGYKLSKDSYDMLLISSKAFAVDSLQEQLRLFLRETKDIYIIPYVDHVDFSYTTILDFSNVRLSAIHIENRLLSRENRLVKNIFEKALVLLIFPIALTLHLFLWLGIRLDSPGNIIFKQKRLGKNGVAFSCYKYRTMYTNGDTLLKNYLEQHPEEVIYYQTFHKYKNDPRVTKIGKFLRKTSLDEFPQFYNILRGDMNLIGPRPYMVEEKEAIGINNLDIILAAKPGLTGLWQVNGRSQLTFMKRVELDIWYIQNWSLWIDFVIFLKTLKVVLSKTGAN